MDREVQDIVEPLSPTRDSPLSPLDVTTPVTSEGDNLTTSFLTTKEKDKKETLFLEVWAQYPRKVAKPAAERAYLKALKKYPHAQILAGVLKHAAAWERDGTDRQFIPHPATFLNQERFNDEPQPPKRTKASERADEVEKYKRRIAEMFDPGGSGEGAGAAGFGDGGIGETINGRCDVVAECFGEGSGQVFGGSNQARDFGASENITVLAPSIGPDEAHCDFGEGDVSARISGTKEAEGVFLEHASQASKRSRQA